MHVAVMIGEASPTPVPACLPPMPGFGISGKIHLLPFPRMSGGPSVQQEPLGLETGSGLHGGPPLAPRCVLYEP